MEIELTGIHFDADINDVRGAIAAVVHGPDLYDPNEKENRGRVPNFQIFMGKNHAGGVHNGKATLRVYSKLGRHFIKWYWESKKNKIVIKGRRLKVFNLFSSVPRNIKQTLEKSKQRCISTRSMTGCALT